MRTGGSASPRAEVFFILNKNDPNFWRLLQIADSAFPTGGFAHSGGIEAAVQHGELRTIPELVQFLEDSLWQLAHGSLPFANEAHAHRERFSECDELAEVFLTNHVARRASAVQGRTFLGTCEKAFAFGWEKSPELHYHLAPVFGAVLHDLSIERTDMQRAFLHISLRGLLSSAVRLGLVGPYQGQEIQRKLSTTMEMVIHVCQDLGLHDVAQTAPLIDLFQNNQDRLYSRLFQS